MYTLGRSGHQKFRGAALRRTDLEDGRRHSTMLMINNAVKRKVESPAVYFQAIQSTLVKPRAVQKPREKKGGREVPKIPPMLLKAKGVKMSTLTSSHDVYDNTGSYTPAFHDVCENERDV